MDNKTYIEIEERVWKIFDTWRMAGITPYEAVRNILYVLTLKRMLDERIMLETEDVQKIMDLQRCFYVFREGHDEDILFNESGRLIETRYGLPQGLFSKFFVDSNVGAGWKEAFQNSLKRIGELVIVEDEIYSSLAEKLIVKGIQMQGYKAGEFLSSNPVAELLKMILEVEDNDKFCDGTIGSGISAVRCVEGTEASIWGMDINIATLQVTAMYLIISGKRNFELNIGDFTLEKAIQKFDKIAMEIPFRVRIGEPVGEQLRLAKKWMEVEQCRELDALFIARILEILKDDGRAVVVVPNSLLFRISKAERNFREKLIEIGMLKAVISLPPVHYGAGIKSSIIVLEKTEEEILFIDLDSENGDFFQRQRRDVPVLTAYGKEKLKEIIKEKTEIIGISRKVSKDEICAKEYDLSPTIYLPVDEEINYMGIEEINNELKCLYEELNQIEELNRKMKLFN